MARRAPVWLAIVLGLEDVAGSMDDSPPAAVRDTPTILAAADATANRELVAALEELVEMPVLQDALRAEVAAKEAVEAAARSRHARAAAAAKKAYRQERGEAAGQRREDAGLRREPGEERRSARKADAEGAGHSARASTATVDTPLTDAVERLMAASTAVTEVSRRYKQVLEELPRRYEELVRKRQCELTKVSNECKQMSSKSHVVVI